MTEIYLVRHGEAEGNKLNFVQGQINTNLTEKGKIQAKNIAKELKKIVFDEIYSSDLNRAKNTAKEINAYQNKQIIFDLNLRERNYGELEGKFEKEYLKWKPEIEDKFTKKAPNGENFLDIINRIKIFFENKKFENKKILIVCHGGTIKAIIKFLTKKELIEVSKIKINHGKPIILKLNRNKVFEIIN